MFELVHPLSSVSYLKIPDSGGFSAIYWIGHRDEGFLVDTYLFETAEEIIQSFENNGFRPDALKGIVVTHAHRDHYGGVAKLQAWSQAPVYAHPVVAQVMKHPVDSFIAEGDVLSVAGSSLNVLHIPGHDESAIALFESCQRILFSGDLIQGGMDSTQTWLGLFTDVEAQRKSLERIFALRPEWNFKGHRMPRQGSEIAMDIQCALNRLDAIEVAVLKVLDREKSLTEGELLKACLFEVLRLRQEVVPQVLMPTIKAFVRYLSGKGRIHAVSGVVSLK